MEIKVFHMYTDKSVAKEDRKCYFKQIGVAVCRNESDALTTAEIIWDLTNHSCWNGENKKIKRNGWEYKPTQYDRGYSNDDICFEYHGLWYVAKSYGWRKCKTLENAKRYLWLNASWVRDYLPKGYRYKDIIL